MKKSYSKVLFLLMVQLFWAGLSLFAQPYFLNNQDPLPSSKKWVKVENMSDEFNGNSLNGAKWQSQPIGNGWVWLGRAPGIFDPSAISVANGKLRVTVSKLPKEKTVKGHTYKYQGAIVRSIKPGQPGWYYECRMKANATEMSSTFWLMSKNSNCMKKLELDIQECVGKTSHLTHPWAKNWDKVYHSNCIHRSTNCHPTPVQKQGSMIPSIQNHKKYFVYGCWWKSPKEVQFFLDGKYVYSITPSTDFDMPSWIQMAIETYDWNPVPSNGGMVKSGTWEERTTQYDWVRVWKTEANNNNNPTPTNPTPSTGSRKVSLQNVGNKMYISSENGTAPMTCNRSSVGTYETFTMIPLSNGKYVFKGNNGKYICSENGTMQMNCNRSTIGTWEQFTLINKGNNNYVLKGNNGQHVRPSMWCTSTETDTWRQFKIVNVSGTPAPNPNPTPTQTQMTLNPINDTYMEGSANRNNTLLRIEKNRRVIYLQYDLSGMSNISSASLKMTCTGDSGNGNIDVYKGSSNNWTENNLSNANKPNTQTKLGSLNKTYSVGSSYTWTLNAANLTAGGKLSLVLVQTGGNDAAFGSKENGVGGPKLIVNGTKLKAASINVESNAQTASKPEIQIYPNPFTEAVSINLGQKSSYTQLRVVSFDGRVLYTQSLEGKSGVIEVNTALLSQAASGMYLFQFIGTNGVETMKVMKK